MAGLVAVSILANQTRDIGSCVIAQVAIGCQKGIQVIAQALIATQQTGQTLYIVGYQEGVLPGVTLGIVTSLTIRVEVLGQGTELTLHILGTHTLNTCIPQYLVTLTQVVETNAVFLVSQLTCNLSGSPSSNVVFHALGNRFTLAAVIGQVTQFGQIILATQGNTTVLCVFCRQHASLYSLVHFLGIDICALVLQDDVSQNGNSRLANHTIGIATYQVPYGQLAPLVVHIHHRVCVVAHTVWHNKGCQRMCSTIGVPEAPSGQVREICTTMNLSITTHIVACYIVPNLRSYHVVIHGGIEDGALALCAEGCLNATQLLVPSLAGSIGNLVEVKAGHFSVHVDKSICFAGRRNRYLCQNLIVWTNFEGSLAILGVHTFGKPVMHGMAKTDAEEYFLVRSPSCTSTISHQCIVVYLNSSCLTCVITNGVLQVNDDACVVATLGISKAVKSYTLCCCYLSLNAKAIQHYAIVAGNCNLGLVAVIAGQTFTRHL